jgi:hypothetical protein
MATKNKHPLAIFGGDTTKGTGVSGREWDISLIDKSEWICEPERDRRIIYRVDGYFPTAEARIREARNGSKLELLIVMWSDAADDDTQGIRAVKEDVPADELTTLAKRRAYLKKVVRLTETIAKRMKQVDRAITDGVAKL